MQTLAQSVWRSLDSQAPRAKLIAHGGGNRTLPFWLLHALPRVALAIIRRDVDSVITGDALMYALTRPLMIVSHIPHASMIIGLDITYENRLYRTLVHRALRRAPRLAAISRSTAIAAEGIGIQSERITVIGLGVPAPQMGEGDRRQASTAMRKRLSIGNESVVLLTLGRLVRRKGVAWFIGSILPRLPSHVIYLVAGGGPLEEECRRAVSASGLEDRVRILGQVDDPEREELLRGADIFVQPNIRVPGDIEGFGLVVLEASIRGTTTVASGLEGILDAVVDGHTGFLLPPEDEDAWVNLLTGLVAEPERLPALGAQFQEAAQRLFSEETMGLRLLELLAQPESTQHR
jgi:phosphatidylinositol alpha-1,6-mannosyltransferase